jgi:hypothetical protein
MKAVRTALANSSCRDTANRDADRDIAIHDCICGDRSVVADVNRTEDLSAWRDPHPITKSRVLAIQLADRHALVDPTPAPDSRTGTDHNGSDVRDAETRPEDTARNREAEPFAEHASTHLEKREHETAREALSVRFPVLRSSEEPLKVQDSLGEAEAPTPALLSVGNQVLIDEVFEVTSCGNHWAPFQVLRKLWILVVLRWEGKADAKNS